MSIICCQKVFRIIQNLHQNGRPSRMEAILKCRHYLGIAHGEGGSQRLPGWVGKTFIRNEVPPRASLSAGRRVQKLFGQCPNSACVNLSGASLMLLCILYSQTVYLSNLTHLVFCKIEDFLCMELHVVKFMYFVHHALHCTQ